MKVMINNIININSNIMWNNIINNNINIINMNVLMCINV